jgi:hypothetical protein
MKPRHAAALKRESMKKRGPRKERIQSLLHPAQFGVSGSATEKPNACG